MLFDPSINLPYDTQRCECCQFVIDECICPECPVCGEQGDPSCYTDSNCGMIETQEQKDAIEDYLKEEKAFAEFEREHLSVYDLYADLYPEGE